MASPGNVGQDGLTIPKNTYEFVTQRIRRRRSFDGTPQHRGGKNSEEDVHVTPSRTRNLAFDLDGSGAGPSNHPTVQGRRSSVGFRDTLDPNKSMVQNSDMFQPAAVVNNIRHPVLDTLDPKGVIKFLHLREEYEDKIEALQTSSSAVIQFAPWKISVKRNILKTLYTLGKFSTIAPGISYSGLNSDHIREVILGIADKSEKKSLDSTKLERIAKSLRVNMKIEDPEARIQMLVAEFSEKLINDGMPYFIDSEPKAAIRMLSNALYPLTLRAKVRQDLRNSYSLQRNFVEFVVHASSIAEKLEIYEIAKKALENEKRDRFPDNSGNGSSNYRNEGKNSDTPRKAPLCLWPPHKEKGIRCWINECKECPEPDKKKLLEAHKKEQSEKRKKKSGLKKLGTGGPSIENAVLSPNNIPVLDEKEDDTRFIIDFGCNTRAVLCGDGGSCANILPKDVAEELEKKKAKVHIEEINPPKVFDLAVSSNQDGDRISVHCNQKVTFPEVNLDCRHGTALTLRNSNWMVPIEPCQEALLGRPTLRKLELNTSEIFRAAAAANDGVIDVGKECEKTTHGKIALIMDHSLYHGKIIDGDGGILDEKMMLDIGPTNPEEKDDLVSKSLADAEKNGISAEGSQTLAEILSEYDDVIRVRLGNDPPALVPPMNVRLVDNARSVMDRPRRYSKEQRMFIKNSVTRLEEYGMARQIFDASWVSAPLLVPKPPPSMFRLTFDLRKVNSATVPEMWTLPLLDAETGDLKDARYFAIVDFVQSYFQMPLHVESQKLHAFNTPRGIFAPTRVLQGGRNAVIHFQRHIEPLFAKLRSNIKSWIDDFLLYAKTEEELLRLLEQFFEICRTYRLKVSIKKSTFFALSVKWCGRIWSRNGVKFNPSNAEGLANMTDPKTAAELSQVVNCLQWMSIAIPKFAERVGPLRKILEKAYKRSGKRTSKSIKSIQLVDLGWGKNEQTLYEGLITSLREHVEIAYPDSEKAICVHTDASEYYWAGVVTQCEEDELNKPRALQTHEPLGFLSSSFSGAKLGWSTYEKEAFAIVQTFKKMEYAIISSKKTFVFTDHRNLLFVFNPRAMNPDLKAHIVKKVQRWALYLSQFTYYINHVPGDENIMADIMTRWCKGYRYSKISRIQVANSDRVPSVQDSDFHWPTSNDIEKAQSKYSKHRPKNATKTGGIYYLKEKIWIPTDASNLQLSIICVAHTGHMGHRGADATLSTIRENYSWKFMKEDVNIFVKNCLGCICTRSGKHVPRPLMSTFHASKPNELLHFDYLYMGQSDSAILYLLVLKDDFSGYIWLVPSESADSETAANAISRWISTFTAMDWWCSDQGSHFKNETMDLLARLFGVHHHFTTTYTPWANGTVERVMREVRRACDSILRDFKLAPQDWPNIVHMVQSILNSSPLKRLGKNDDGTMRTPLQVMTSLRPKRTVLKTKNVNDAVKVKSISHARAVQLMQIDSIQKAMEDMHRSSAETISRKRATSVREHNRKTNIVSPNFNIGDLVLVRSARKSGHKLKFVWMGPRVIVKAISMLVYTVRDLITGDEEQVHCVRMVLYRADWKGKEVSEKLLEDAKHSTANYEMIEKLLEIGEEDGKILVRVQWQGMPDERDHTWQTIDILNEDVPEMLTTFLASQKNTKQVKRAKAALSMI